MFESIVWLSQTVYHWLGSPKHHDTCLLDQMLLQQQQQLLARGQQHCPSIANQRKLVASSGCRAARRAAQRKLFTPAATAAPAAEAAPGAAKGGRPRKYAPRKPKDAEEQQTQQDEPDLPVVRSQQKQASSSYFIAPLSTWVASACLKGACHMWEQSSTSRGRVCL